MAIHKYRTWCFIGLGLLSIITCLVVLYVGYRLFHPYNEVVTDIRGIPPSTTFICVVADTEDGPQAMEWSLSKLLPFSMHPDGCTVSYVREAETTRHEKVRWIESHRVGVLHENTDGEWHIAWFEPANSAVADRSVLFGGGSIEIDISDAGSRPVRHTSAATESFVVPRRCRPKMANRGANNDRYQNKPRSENRLPIFPSLMRPSLHANCECDGTTTPHGDSGTGEAAARLGST